MTTNNAPGVLAVMDAELARYESSAEMDALTCSDHAAEDIRRRAQPLRQARDAVAELIAANVELEEANADPAHTLGRDLRVVNAEKRLRAALAACGEVGL